jgi:hypothetical protein
MILLLRLIATYALWIGIAGFVALAYYLRELVLARRESGQSLFGLEREAARQRQVRALLMLVLVFSILAVTGVIVYNVAPRLDALPEPPGATPSGPLVATPPTSGAPLPGESLTPSPTVPAQLTPGPGATPSGSPEPSPTSAEESPTPAPTAPPVAGCEDPNQYISAPASGTIVDGVVQIYGTADIPAFEYYKFEISGDATGGQWEFIAASRQPVRNGQLGTWDTSIRAPGSYQFRLVVVDNTGNFPPPCTIELIIQRP